MTGPKDPGSHDSGSHGNGDSDDWGFPDVDPAGPASTQLPAAEPEPEVVYDTGSDAWWRAQAQAQRAAAQGEPTIPPTPPPTPEPVAPPELVEPEVLVEPTPLDQGWLPPDLPELAPTEPAPVHVEPAPVHVKPEPVHVEPEPVHAPVTPAPVPVAEAAVTDPHGLPPREDRPTWTAPPEAEVEPERVAPARVLAGAALAVAGVALGIGALLLVGEGEPKGNPVVAQPSSTAGPSATPSPTPSATVSPTPLPSATSTAPAVVVTSEPPTTAPIVAVTVLNNSRIKGLADRSAARFRAGGWPVALTGNYRGSTLAVTTVYFGPGQQRSAQRFATQFGIDRVVPRFPGLPGSGVTVVLTRDFA